MRVLPFAPVLLMVLLSGPDPASPTDLGDGNDAVAKTFAAWKEAGPRLEKRDAPRRVLVSGFGLFSGIDFNISGVVVESMADKRFWPAKAKLDALPEPPPAEAVGAGRLAAKDGGARVWQRTLEIDGQRYEVGFLLLDVLWDLGAAILLHEAQHFDPHLIVMTGRGGEDAIFEAGALNQAVRAPGFRSDGSRDDANTPELPNVLDPDEPGVEPTIGMTWDNTRLAEAARPVVARLGRGYTVRAADAARVENTYICNNISCAVLHGIKRSQLSLAGGRIVLRDLELADTAAGFFHYPAAATNEPREVQAWAAMLATVLRTHFAKN